MTGSFREKAAIDATRAEEVDRAAAADRLEALEPTRAEADAIEFVRKLQGTGAPYETALLVLRARPALTPGAAVAVVDHAYCVGQPLERTEPEPGAKLDTRLRPDSGALVPELDVDDLFGGCPVVARRVREVAAASLVTPCMPAVAALAMMSIAMAARVKGVVVNIDGSRWSMYPNQFFGVEAVSGGKKTLVRKRMGGSMLAAYAQDLRLRWHDVKTVDEHERDVTQGKISVLRAAEIKGKPCDEVQLKALRDRLSRPQVCVPEIMLSGGTPEQYVRRLRQSGYSALVPDEGKQALEKFIGGHDGAGEKCSALLSAHTVEFFVNDTITGDARGDTTLPFQILCGGAYLPMQPSVLTPATQHEAQLLAAIQTRGLLARMLVARPRQLAVWERKALRERLALGEIGCDAEAEYDDLMRTLLYGGEHGNHPLAPSQPRQMVFTSEANKLFLDFQADAEDSAAPGGQYHTTPGSEFVRRQADHVARLATELAVLRDGEIRDGYVELDDVERAVRAMRNYFLPHALAVAVRTVHDPIGDDADHTWQLVAAEGKITQRELTRRLGRGWTKAKAGDKQSRLDAALEELSDRGRIVIDDGPRRSRLVRVIGRSMT